MNTAKFITLQTIIHVSVKKNNTRGCIVSRTEEIIEFYCLLNVRRESLIDEYIVEEFIRTRLGNESTRNSPLPAQSGERPFRKYSKCSKLFLIGVRLFVFLTPGLIDQDALIEILQSRKIGGAALDVTTPEPLPSDHPLFRLDNAREY